MTDTESQHNMTFRLEGEASAGTGLRRARQVIVVVDVVESVRLIRQHEAATIDRWVRFVEEVSDRVLPGLQGRVIKSLGDGLLLA